MPASKDCVIWKSVSSRHPSKKSIDPHSQKIGTNNASYWVEIDFLKKGTKPAMTRAIPTMLAQFNEALTIYKSTCTVSEK